MGVFSSLRGCANPNKINWKALTIFVENVIAFSVSLPASIVGAPWGRLAEAVPACANDMYFGGGKDEDNDYHCKTQVCYEEILQRLVSACTAGVSYIYLLRYHISYIGNAVIRLLG